MPASWTLATQKVGPAHQRKEIDGDLIYSNWRIVVGGVAPPSVDRGLAAAKTGLSFRKPPSPSTRFLRRRRPQNRSLTGLRPEQRVQATFAFNDDERRNGTSSRGIQRAGSALKDFPSEAQGPRTAGGRVSAARFTPNAAQSIFVVHGPHNSCFRPFPARADTAPGLWSTFEQRMAKTCLKRPGNPMRNTDS